MARLRALWQARRDLRQGVYVAVGLAGTLWLIPDVYFGPYQAINVYAWWRIATILVWLTLAGHAVELYFGSRLGLTMTGLAGGLVSSTATIGSMAARVASEPARAHHAAAGALASSISTYGMMAMLIASGDWGLLRAMAWPLLGGAIALVVVIAILARHGETGRAAAEPTDAPAPMKVGVIVAFVGLFALFGVLARVVGTYVGDEGMIAVSAVTGLVDAHATAASTALLHAQQQVATGTAIVAVLVALSTNTLSKVVMARSAGHAAFSRDVTLGLAIALGVTWLGWAAGRLL